MFFGGRARSLGLFEVLARNRQSALEQRSGTLRAREQPNRLRTIPPRQRLPVTKRLAIRTRRVIRVVINVKIHKKREKQTLLNARRPIHRFLLFSSLSVQNSSQIIQSHVTTSPLSLTNTHASNTYQSAQLFPSTSIQRRYHIKTRKTE